MMTNTPAAGQVDIDMGALVASYDDHIAALTRQVVVLNAQLIQVREEYRICQEDAVKDQSESED